MAWIKSVCKAGALPAGIASALVSQYFKIQISIKSKYKYLFVKIKYAINPQNKLNTVMYPMCFFNELLYSLI